MINRIKNSQLNNSGSTMVEVLMGFVLLSLMIGMLTGIISVANNMYTSSVDKRHVQDRLEEELYKKDFDKNMVPANAADHITMTPASNMPGSKSAIDISADIYDISTADLVDTADMMEMSIYFIKSTRSTTD